MKKYAKQTALALAMALTVTSVAPATASAASAPKYKKEYNTVKKGKSYAYTVKNIKKGTKVKWSLVGTGKKYVSFNKSKAVYSETTKAAKTKTYSTNKIYIRKNTSKVVKVVVKASVTGKNGKKYSVTDKIAIAKTATKPTATPATTASTTPSTAPSTTPAATATGAATATPSVAPTATSAATATPSVAPSASTTPSTAPTATASTKPSATPAATATTKPSAAPVVTNGAITVTSNATGASVKVLNGTTVVATGTIANGKAVLPKVANGSYTVEVSAAGFVTATKAVVVNGDVTVDVQLKASKEFTAKQTGRQKILVTGTNLSDKVTDYSVKRGNIVVAIDNVVLSADKTSATLTAVTSALATGDYTVTFGTQTYTFKAEAEKTAKVEFIGENLVLTADGAKEAVIGFKATNQFGENVADIDPSVTSSFGNASIKKGVTRTANGEILVSNLNLTATPLNSKGTVVLVDKKTGLSSNVVVTLSSAATVDKVEVAGLYKEFETPEKATKVESIETNADVSKYAVLLKAYDQYGNANASVFTVTSPASVTLTAAGNTGLNVGKDTKKVTVGQSEYVAIPLAKLDNIKELTAGSTNITIVGNKKGLLATFTITVNKAVAVESIKLSPAGTIYNGTKSEVSYVAKDTNGKEITDYNTLNSTNVEFTANGDFNWERQKDGSAKLFFTPKVKDIPGSETASQPTVVTTKVGNNIDVANFTIYNSKIAKAISGVDKDVALATVVSNGAVTLKAKDIAFVDQYGSQLTDDEAAKLVQKLDVAIEDEANAKGFKKAGIAATNKEVTSKDTEIVKAIADTKEGRTKLKFTLKDAKGNEVKNSEYVITIQSVKIDDITDFAIGDLKQLYLEPKTATTAVSGSSIDLKVTGKVGATTVSLTPDDYNIIPNNIVDNDGNGKIYAKAGAPIVNKDNNYASKTEKLEVVIKNAKGSSVAKDITVSSVEPKAQTVALKENKSFELERNKDGVILADDVYGANADTNLLEVKDQYGRPFYNAANVRIQYTNIPDGITVENNNTYTATLKLDGKTISSNKTYTVGVTLTFKSGVTYTDTLLVKVVDKVVK